MRKKRLIVFILVSVFASLMLAGCQAQTVEESQSASPEQTEAESPDVQTEADDADGEAGIENENTVYGTVETIDGNVLTLELGTLNEEAQLRSQNGQGQGEPPSGDTPDGAMPSDMPAEENRPSDMPSGEQPSDRPSSGDAPSLLTLTGETITVTVDDETSIVSFSGEEDTDGLASIEVGSMLKIIYADDGDQIESITIMGGMGGFSGKPGEAAAELSPAS